MKSLFIFFLLIFISCQTPQTELPKPKDFTEVIEEIKDQEKKEPVKEKRDVLQKARETIQYQSTYSNECYEKLQDIETRLSKLEKDNKELKEENKELKEKLWEYQKIEIGFWILVAIIILSILWKFFSPFLLPILKKSLGIPI